MPRCIPASRSRPTTATALMALMMSAGVACAPGSARTAALDFATVRPAGQLHGRWVGGTNVTGRYVLIEAEFLRRGAEWTGELRAPSENVSRLPVSGVDLSSGSVAFSFTSPFGTHRAHGTWQEGMIIGQITGGGLTGEFHLLPVHETPPELAAQRTGSFTAGGAHHLLLVRRANGELAWSETEPLDDGALWIAGGGLFGYSRDTLYSDRSIRAQPRDREWVVFGDDGIEWHPETRPQRTTRRAPRQVVQEEVAFTNGDARLSGTLLLPDGEGPHPAAVLVHGSGPAERSNLLAMARAELLLRQGVGVLIYDKRGVGGSSGDWERAGIDALAGDAAAAVALLRAHPRVRHDAVGLYGQSQAGWVIPAAAARGTGADFLIVFSGGALPAADQEMFRARAEAAAAGADADAAAELMELKWRFASTGSGWTDFLSRLRGADPRIVAIVEATADSSAAGWALPRRLARYAPLPDLQSIRVPTLVVFGEDDDNVPAARAADAWRHAVSPSLLTVEIIPGVGHALVEQRPGRSVFPAALVRRVGEWLSARGWSAEGR